MAEAAVPQTFYEKPLFKLINARFPEFRTSQGIFDVREFGKAISMSHEGIYKWFRANKMSPDGVKKVVALSKDAETGEYRVQKEELYPFCFPA